MSKTSSQTDSDQPLVVGGFCFRINDTEVLRVTETATGGHEVLAPDGLGGWTPQLPLGDRGDPNRVSVRLLYTRARRGAALRPRGCAPVGTGAGSQYTAPAARPREGRGSRRHSTRGGTEDDSSGESEPPGGEPVGRRTCAAEGCESEVKKGEATCSRCRQARSRASKAKAAPSRPATPALDAYRAYQEDKPVDPDLVDLDLDSRDLTLSAVLDGDSADHPEQLERADLIAYALRFGVSLNAEQAEALTSCCHGSPRELLRRIVEAKRRSERRHIHVTHGEDAIRGDYCGRCGLKQHPNLPVCCLGSWLAARVPIDPSRWPDVRAGIVGDVCAELDRRRTPGDVMARQPRESFLAEFGTSRLREVLSGGSVLPFPPRSMPDHQVAALLGLPWDNESIETVAA